MSKPAAPGDNPRLGDAPVEPGFRQTMNSLAGAIDQILNGELTGPDRKNGFILMVFPFGDGEDRRTNYVSNARREDVVIMLKAQLARFEGQPDVTGHA